MFRCFFLAKQRNCSVFIEAKSLENVHRHFVLERFNDFIYIKINLKKKRNIRLSIEKIDNNLHHSFIEAFKIEQNINRYSVYLFFHFYTICCCF